jgi:hypothetical protein
MQRTAVSSVGVTLAVCMALALGIWTVLGFYGSGQTGRGLVLIAVGLFALTMAVWSRLRGTKDEDL